MFLSEMPRLLPRPLFAKVMKDQIRKKAQQELDRNRGRALYFFLLKMQEGARGLKGEAREVLTSIQDALNQADRQVEADVVRSEGDAEAKIEELRERLARLSELRSKLDPCAATGVAS